MTDEEMNDEMKIVIKSRMARHILSSMISKTINDKIPLGLNLDINELVVDTLPDGTLTFQLSANGTASKNKIFNLIGRKGGV